MKKEKKYLKEREREIEKGKQINEQEKKKEISEE